MNTEVLIVGAGPCGATIANLLGVYGVRTILLDRAPAVIDYPRGVGVDDESLRVFQACGLGREVHADMIQNQALIWFDSNQTKLAEIAPSGQPFGWPRRNSFLQPMLETKLRTGLERFEHVQLLLERELVGMRETGDGVEAHVIGADGTEETITAQYVVGADGGRSTVRKLIGAVLEGSTLGTRIDPVITALGRVLLANLPPAVLQAYLERRQQFAPAPQIPPDGGFTDDLDRIREQGWCLMDQEIEVGVRTIAAPLRNSAGTVIAGINVAAHTARVSLERLQDEFLPELLDTQARIEKDLAEYGPDMLG